MFLAGAASALLYSMFGPLAAIRGGGEMVAIALNIANHGTFSDPFIKTIPTGPTAVVAPLYPAAMGGLILALGWPLATLLLRIGVVLAQGLQAGLLPRLSLLFFNDELPGIYGAILCILLPVFQFMTYWEGVHAGCGLMVFCLLSNNALRKSPSIRSSLLTGAAAGLLVLLSTSSALVIALWVVLQWKRHQMSVRSAVRFVALFGLGAALLLLPWSLRNYSRLGAFGLKDNFGMTLFASNNDCAQASMQRNLATGCYGSHHPAGNVVEARSLAAMGEGAYDRVRTQDAVQWIRHHNGAFLRLTALRVLQFWFPDSISGVYAYSIWMVTAISIPGAYLAFRDRIPARLFLGAVWLVYPLMYYVVVSDYRYRYPILWLSLLAGGYGIARLAARIGIARPRL